MDNRANRNRINKGFTLLEVLVAVLVLGITIAAPLTLASRSLQAAQRSKNRIVATGLAQEGVELIHAIRSSNFLSGRNWDQGLGSCRSPNGCYIDVGDLGVHGCSASCRVLRFDGSLYQYDSGSNSIYTRKVSVSGSGDEMQITASVSWADAVSTQSVDVSEYLFDWQ